MKDSISIAMKDSFASAFIHNCTYPYIFMLYIFVWGTVNTLITNKPLEILLYKRLKSLRFRFEIKNFF